MIRADLAGLDGPVEARLKVGGVERGLHRRLEQRQPAPVRLVGVAARRQAFALGAGRLQHVGELPSEGVGRTLRAAADRKDQRSRQPGGGPVRQMPDHPGQSRLDRGEGVLADPADQRQVLGVGAVLDETLERGADDVQIRQHVAEPGRQRFAELERTAEGGHGEVGHQRQIGRVAVQGPVVGRQFANPTGRTRPAAGHAHDQRAGGRREIVTDVGVEQRVESVERGFAIRIVRRLDLVEHVGMAADGPLAEDHHAAGEDVGAFHCDVDRCGLEAARDRIRRPEHDRLARVYVHGVLGDLLRHGGDVVLRDAGGDRRLLAQVDRVGGEAAHRFAGVGPAGDAGQRLLYTLEAADGDVELAPDHGVGAGEPRAGDRVAGRARGQGDRAAHREALHQHAPALTDHRPAADDAVQRDEHIRAPGGAVLERCAGGKMPAPGVYAGGVGGHQRAGHAEIDVVAEQAVRIVHPDGEAEHRGHGRQGDVALVPGQAHAEHGLAVPLAVADDAAVRDGACVRAGVRAGQAEAGNLVAGGQPRQVVILLRLGAVVHEQFGRAERIGHRHDRAHGAAGGAAAELG